MLTEQHPFHEYPPMAVIYKVVRGERPARPALQRCHLGKTDDMWELIEKAWQQDPSNRPSMPQLEERLRPTEANETRHSEIVERSTSRASFFRYGPSASTDSSSRHLETSAAAALSSRRPLPIPSAAPVSLPSVSAFNPPQIAPVEGSSFTVRANAIDVEHGYIIVPRNSRSTTRTAQAWYLEAQHAAEELTLALDQTVIVGTLRALVERLTAGSASEHNYCSAVDHVLTE
jgi:hypothetical protein